MKYRLGERFGRYEIQRLIGEGGLASVYLARDADLGRDVVVKLCRHADATDWARSWSRKRESSPSCNIRRS